MISRSPQTLSWPALLAALRNSSGDVVYMRDGRMLEPTGSIRDRPSAKGVELCLFSADAAGTRVALITQLESLAKSAGRRFITSARVRIGDAHLLVESVADEEIDGARVTVIRARRPKLGYNQSMQTGDSTTLRSKRIKNR